MFADQWSIRPELGPMLPASDLEVGITQRCCMDCSELRLSSGRRRSEAGKSQNGERKHHDMLVGPMSPSILLF